MFLHAISPDRAFNKVAHSLTLHTAMDPVARLLLGYVGGLRPCDEYKSLSAYAAKLGIKPGTYKRIKKEMVQFGYVHDHRAQGAKGRWYTEQWVSNVPLTDEQFAALRRGDASPGASPGASQGASPGASKPTVGGPTVRRLGGSTGTTKTNSKTSPTRPPQKTVRAEQPEASTPQIEKEPQFALAERILRELQSERSDLRMTFRNVRYLAGNIAERLKSGIPAWEIHHALSHDLPDGPILNAAGFVTTRLRRNVPDVAGLAAADAARAAAPAPSAVPPGAPAAPGRALVECDGPGTHAFRPVADETLCGSCRRAYPQLEAHLQQEQGGGGWAPAAPTSYPEPPF
ncbi:hypothetical protein [Streptomyces sp. NPDC048442]|uniref:hypothetical protein n=1 Tax=Streptomyces sp. NPDC048442 TaxID=3154823 RepID=UPI00342E01AF